MAYSVQNALNALRALGTVEEMRALARQGYGADYRPDANSHIHLPPNFSAFDSVEQAVGLAEAQKVQIVGVTNYYDYRVYGDFAARARSAGIFPLFGLEIISLIDDLAKSGVRVNDPNNPGRMYLCGKGALGIAAPSARATELLDVIRRNDTERMAVMTAKTAEIFRNAGIDTGIDDAQVIAMIVERHGSPRDSVTIQERHIAMAFQEALFRMVPAADRATKLAQIYEPRSGDTLRSAGVPAASGACPPPVKVQGELRSRLLKSGKPAFVEERFLNFEDAYELIVELGAIPCYPTLADGADPICTFEDPPETLIANMKARNLHMAEYIPLRNTPEMLTTYVTAVRDAGIAVVGGTEHNTLDLLPLAPKCLKGAEVPPQLKSIFLEGARIVAAHQFLTLHGACGFVDARGNPNPDYGTPEARIEAFAALGAAVIGKYRDSGHP